MAADWSQTKGAIAELVERLDRAEAERDDLAARVARVEAERDKLKFRVEAASALAVEWYARAEYNESEGLTRDAWWRGFTLRLRESADELLPLLRGEGE